MTIARRRDFWPVLWSSPTRPRTNDPDRQRLQIWSPRLRHRDRRPARRRVASELRVGRVVINGMMDDPQAPWADSNTPASAVNTADMGSGVSRTPGHPRNIQVTHVSKHATLSPTEAAESPRNPEIIEPTRIAPIAAMRKARWRSLPRTPTSCVHERQDPSLLGAAPRARRCSGLRELNQYDATTHFVGRARSSR